MLLTRTTQERTNLQWFVSDQPRSSFEKRVVSTPRLIRSLHTMSPAKAVPDVLQESRVQERAFRELCTRNEGTEPRVLARHSVTHEAFLTLVRSAQKAIGRKGVLGPHTRNLPNLMRVVLRSRNSSETMVEASTECSTTLRFQRFSRRESFAPREASRGLC